MIEHEWSIPGYLDVINKEREQEVMGKKVPRTTAVGQARCLERRIRAERWVLRKRRAAKEWLPWELEEEEKNIRSLEKAERGICKLIQSIIDYHASPECSSPCEDMAFAREMISDFRKPARREARDLEESISSDIKDIVNAHVKLMTPHDLDPERASDADLEQIIEKGTKDIGDKFLALALVIVNEDPNITGGKKE